MNYLAMLKAEFSENTLPSELTKATEAPSVSSVSPHIHAQTPSGSFVSTPRGHISGIEEASDGASTGAIFGVGMLVSWQSPLFGRCTGRIALVHDEYEWMLIAEHPATKEPAFISKMWDVRVIESSA